MPIRAILTEALQKTLDDLPAEVDRMPLKLWDESVFRYFLARNLLDLDRSLVIEREWRKVDLAIASQAGIALVEIKFWQLGNLNDALTYQKHGGPGKQNLNEFNSVLAKLKKILVEQPWGSIAAAYLVLVYADPVTATAKATFGKYYDKIDACWLFRSPPVDGRVLTCKLIEVTP